MLKLEVFETHNPEDPSGYLDPQSAVKDREAAYAQGFEAGWKAATEKMRSAEAQLRAATLEAVQALTFTYAEAREMTEAQVSDLVQGLVTLLLPDVIEAALPGRVAQELRQILARDKQATIGLRCRPEMRVFIDPIVADLPSGTRVTLEETDEFDLAQVEICGRDQKRVIDLASLQKLLVSECSHVPITAAKGIRHG